MSVPSPGAASAKVSGFVLRGGAKEAARKSLIGIGYMILDEELDALINNLAANGFMLERGASGEVQGEAVQAARLSLEGSGGKKVSDETALKFLEGLAASEFHAEKL